MTFKVQAGPDRIAIHQAMTILVSGPDGHISDADQQGLFFRDTRVISAWGITVDGQAWELLSGGAVSFDIARIFLVNPTLTGPSQPVPRRTISLMINRGIDGGMREDLTLTNHGGAPVHLTLSLRMESDFADIFEAKAARIPDRGENSTVWSPQTQTLTSTHRNQDFLRAITVTVQGAQAAWAENAFRFHLALAPGERWDASLLYDLSDGVETLAAPRHPAAATDSAATWRQSALKIEASDPSFHAFCDQAADDLAALRLPISVDGQEVTMPAAGLPWFVAPFGRDSLIVSLQAMPLWPDFARGSLAVLGHYQARDYDDRRDAEPGKIMHELRYGELAHFKLVPHTPYYGTADATALFLITLHEGWKATGDRGLLARHMPRAEAALRWIDTDGDPDGSGFQAYQTRSAGGYENMAWKDSGDAINNPDGTPVRGPKALCELQGYTYDAWLRMADIFLALHQPDRAATLRGKAAALRERFNAIFWDEPDGFYALTLDGEKRPVFSAASNPGHLLWSGIVPIKRAERVVRRLMAPDMFSGWGIRTLSAAHACYNPHSYQNGSVWPHDNSLIALGMKRYGFTREAATIARAIADAAGHFQSFQIPELYAGLPREKMSFPVRYAGANVPQGWAAGSAFALLQALLGLAPDAPNDRLYVDPALPDWMPEITLRGLRCGTRTYDIRFHRDQPPAVLNGDPAAVVVGVRPGSAPL